MAGQFRYKINGQYVTKEQFSAHRPGQAIEALPPPAQGTNDWKELHCESLAFDGAVQDAKRIDRELGAPHVEYDHHNRPVFKDRSTYNKYLQAHGYVNRTSGKCQVLSALDLERAKARAKSITSIAAIQPKRRKRA